MEEESEEAQLTGANAKEVQLADELSRRLREKVSCIYMLRSLA